MNYETALGEAGGNYETALEGDGALEIRFGFFGDCGENGEELVGFVLEVRQFCGGDDVGVGEEVEPVAGFVEFLEAVADF